LFIFKGILVITNKSYESPPSGGILTVTPIG